MAIAGAAVGEVRFGRTWPSHDLTELFEWFIRNMFLLPHQNLPLESFFNIMDIYGDTQLMATTQEYVMQYQSWEKSVENELLRTMRCNPAGTEEATRPLRKTTSNKRQLVATASGALRRRSGFTCEEMRVGYSEGPELALKAITVLALHTTHSM